MGQYNNNEIILTRCTCTFVVFVRYLQCKFTLFGCAKYRGVRCASVVKSFAGPSYIIFIYIYVSRNIRNERKSVINYLSIVSTRRRLCGFCFRPSSRRVGGSVSCRGRGVCPFPPHTTLLLQTILVYMRRYKTIYLSV